ADSGKFNAIKDTIHKIISPGTYECNLCDITHGYFSMNKQWKDFLSELDVEIRFLHKDEFLSSHASYKTELPVIMLQASDELETFISSQEINACLDVDVLQVMMMDKMARLTR
ncbi:MAG: hypothetical protein HUJ30_06030, partial [Gammaproteobacteria bacterium]|nr:hypothetical protein [Gammaproteobacteria bacterium]